MIPDLDVKCSECGGSGAIQSEEWRLWWRKYHRFLAMNEDAGTEDAVQAAGTGGGHVRGLPRGAAYPHGGGPADLGLHPAADTGGGGASNGSRAMSLLTCIHGRGAGEEAGSVLEEGSSGHAPQAVVGEGHWVSLRGERSHREPVDPAVRGLPWAGGYRLRLHEDLPHQRGEEVGRRQSGRQSSLRCRVEAHRSRLGLRGAAEARRAHNPAGAGSTPAPATGGRITAWRRLVNRRDPYGSRLELAGRRTRRAFGPPPSSPLVVC
jgi:hypothetical protein